MRWIENTDKPVHGLALCVSKDRTWCGAQEFQRCMNGFSYRSLGKYWSWSFSLNQQNGSYCPWKLISLVLLPVTVKGRTYPCLSCSCANLVEQNKKNQFASKCGCAGHRALTICSYKGDNFWQKVSLAGNNSVSSCLLCICGAWVVSWKIMGSTPPLQNPLCYVWMSCFILCLSPGLFKVGFLTFSLQNSEEELLISL